jgi:hypothetical protein
MTAISRMMPAVFLVTSHGRQALAGEPRERVLDLLNRHGVPWSAVSIFTVSASGGKPTLTPCLDRVLGDMSDTGEILLYFNRNVNPFLFSIRDFQTVRSEDAEPEATEYFYQHFDNARSKADTYLKKLSANECRRIIADRIADALRDVVPEQASLVVGVSGGGDSNAMLHGLSGLRDRMQIRPIIIKGIPEWDAGVSRAQALCDSYRLPLRVMEETEVRELLEIPADGPSLIERFEREFKGDDFEFLATLLIRLALTRYAEEIGTKFICTGANLEDVLSEVFFRHAAGLKPAPFPVRTIGGITLVQPLWLCPKRIIDGCFPTYSRENYEARYPCFSLGRNLYYSTVYLLQMHLPGVLEQLAKGLSVSSLTEPVEYLYNEQLGFEVERPVPFPLLVKFNRMLGRTAAVQ